MPFLIIFLFFNAFLPSKRAFNIMDYGAVADGITLNTQSIQKTIDACTEQGGGRVIVPKGTFLTGSIYLKTGVELHITEGSILLGSTKHRDYKNENPYGWYALIIANAQSHIAITGKGIIDGQGRALAKDVIQLWRAGAFPGAQIWDEKLREKNRPNERFRPQLILLQDCKNISIKGITLKNSTSWVQTYGNCLDLIIEKIRVESTAYWNNDGIDLVDSKNVVIRDCFINAADDAICLKSFDSKSGCQNILIERCTLRSSASALKLGTSSYGGFRKIKAHHLTIYDTYRSAVALECVDGGVMEDIDISDIKAKNTGNAIFIKLGQRIPNRPIGRVENIRISHVEADIPNTKPDKGYELEGPLDTIAYNLLPSSIVGLPNYPIKNIYLKDVHITYGGGGIRDTAYASVDSLSKIKEQAREYPEFSMFGELPAWAIYMRHTEGGVMKNVTVRLKAKDYRPAFVFDDVKQLKLNNIKITDGGSLPSLIFKDVKEPVLKKIDCPKGSSDKNKGLKIVTSFITSDSI